MPDEAIDLTGYLEMLWRRRTTLIAVAAAVLLAVGFAIVRAPHQYQTAAYVRVPNPDAALVLTRYAGIKPIIRAIPGNLQGAATRQSYRTKSVLLTTYPLTDGSLVVFQVIGEGPARVASIATGWARTAVAESKAHSVIIGSPFEVAAEALVPSTPVGLPIEMKLVLAAILGLIAGTVTVSVDEYVRRRRRASRLEAALAATARDAEHHVRV